MTVVACAVLLAAIIVLLGRMRALETRLATARELLAAVPPQTTPELDAAFLAGGRTLISVEILNPLEVAASQNALAKPAGALAPGVVRGIVHAKAVQILEEQLTKHGVEAEVLVHAGR